MVIHSAACQDLNHSVNFNLTDKKMFLSGSQMIDILNLEFIKYLRCGFVCLFSSWNFLRVWQIYLLKIIGLLVQSVMTLLFI